MQVVFTGPATGLNGESIVRDDLITACAVAGISVVKVVKPGVILVASRKDTVKAKAALSAGCAVLTYAEFIGALKQVDVMVEKTGAEPNKYTDAPDDDDQVPDFTKEY